MPSEMEKSDKNSPKFIVPKSDHESRSMVYQSLEEKTEAFLHRQRERSKAHNILLRKDHPIAARVQAFEIGLRKKSLPGPDGQPQGLFPDTAPNKLNSRKSSVENEWDNVLEKPYQQIPMHNRSLHKDIFVTQG
jgi:hypothetical protein